MTQPPRLRRDPRDPASARVRMPAAVAAEPPAERVVDDDPACFILAVVDGGAGGLSGDDRDLLGAARQLADALGGAVVMMACLPPGLVFLTAPEREGVDRVALLRDPAFAEELAEPRLWAVLAVMEQCGARHVLFSGSFVGGELARRVAARLGDRPAFNVQRLAADGLLAVIDTGLTQVERPLPRVIVPARSTFHPVGPTPLREARLIEVQADVGAPRVRSLGPLPLDPATVPLGEADLIISAGGGLTDWTSFHQAAETLGAAEAGSRVVCDAGLLPKSRQVGASGLLVEPRCYLAFGIAGASQHLQGIAGARRVIAVNTDLRADMVRRADLAIVADAQAVLPALVRRAALRRGAGPIDDLAGLSHGPGRPVDHDVHRSDRSKDMNVIGSRTPAGSTLPPSATEAGVPVLALVSLGRHPVSKRARRAEFDSRALELALGCSRAVTALHAGLQADAASILKDHVGAGAAQLVVLACSPDTDPLPALETHIRLRAPRLIVAGARAEAGECSGMVPFILAEHLGYGLAIDVVALDLVGDTARIVQALPGGRRRTLEASLPLIVTVDRTGPDPRLAARMRTLRTVADLRPGSSTDIDDRTRWSVKPGRPRPRRLAAPKAPGEGGGLETDARRQMIAPDANDAADAILDVLVRDGLLDFSSSSSGGTNP